ncbi:hypothetical protein BXT86_03110 [candidate division WOR-3 bacterium 4484_100]|uniref:PatA-like N-terminal domain-containing protein n=1 Tax=candidate division WOR-3 bacterium 4484_100 TaxID=1936077 RepID=A0A1V4QGD7_UNCW3|nr:MAG: hypothetical protein BXT86_03110 [candidate division WOR-3 bacterium 4484_100]
MAIKGSLSEASLPDVIQLLTYSLKSGCLSVTDGKNFGNIFIKDGKIIFATILNRKERLGDILVLKNQIDNEILSRALEIKKSNKKKRLGEILIEMGAITEEALSQALKEQIEQTIFTMLTWEKGYFNFEADLLPDPDQYTVQLSSQELLLEGARRIDEWRKIEDKLPPFETPLVKKENVDNIPLTEQESKIMALVDGTRSIDEILKLSEYDFFETCRTIYGLLSAGFLEKPETPVMKKESAGDITEYKNLGFAFFKTEMLEEATREYNRVLEIKPDDPEALLFLGLISIINKDYEKARDYLSRSLDAEKRLSTLLNLAFVNNKLGHPDKALELLLQAEALAPDNPKVQCNLGITYFKMNDLDKSAEVFNSLKENSPEFVTPYIYLAYIKAGQEDFIKAAELLTEAIDKFPRNAFLKNNLAVLYEQIDRPEEAEKLYREALESDPYNYKVCKNFADFYYEAQILGAAKELYERIPESDADWQVLFNLGNIYLRQGNGEQALELWNKALTLSPENKLILRNIELLKQSSGK